MALYQYFGKPGSGKTTCSAYHAVKALKRGRPVFSNNRIDGCYALDLDNLGLYSFPSNSLLLIDEAGLCYSNRNFSNFSNKDLYFYKYHRHLGVTVNFYTQGICDIDLKLRNLLQQIWQVSPVCFPGFHKIYYDDDWYSNPPTYDYISINWLKKLLSKLSYSKIQKFHNHPKLWTKIPYKYKFDAKKVRKIRMTLVEVDTYINNEDHSAVDGYTRIERTLFNRIFRRDAFKSFKPKRYWKYFDSFSAPDLKPISTDIWDDDRERTILNDMLINAINLDNAKRPKDRQIKVEFASAKNEAEIVQALSNLPPIELKKWDDIPKTEQEIEYEIRNGIKYPKRKD